MAETVVKKLVTQLTLDSKKYTVGMDKAGGTLGKFRALLGPAAAGVAAVGAAMTATAGAAALLTKQTVAQGDKFDKMSQRIGISVEKLSAYEHVADLAGTSVESMAIGVGRLSRNMLDASQGVGEAKDTFDTLGISVTDANGKLRDSDAVMADVAGKFAEMPDGAEKTAMAMEMFGRSGMMLIPMLNGGKEGMADLLVEGTRLRGWTTAQAKEAALLNDNMARLKRTIAGVKDSVGKQLIPAFQSGVEVMNDFISTHKDLEKKGMNSIAKLIEDVFLPALLKIGETVDSVLGIVRIGFKAFKLALMALVKLPLEAISLLTAGLAKTAGWIPGVGGKIKKFAESSKRAYEELNLKIQETQFEIGEIATAHGKTNEKLAVLQDKLAKGYEESRERMAKKEKEFNDVVLADAKDTTVALTEEQKERARKIEEIETLLRDDIAKITLDRFEYAKLKLKEEYEERKKNVEDEKLLKEWYALEVAKIETDMEKDRKSKADARQKAIQKEREKEEEEFNKKYKKIIEFNDDWIDSYVKGESLRESVTKATAGAVQDTLSESTKEKMRTLTEATIKIITGHVAEGLAMVGASSFTVIDAIANIGSYAAQIAIQLAAAKTIAKNVKFDVGGWLGSHPRGGVIREGSSPVADDVLLASRGGLNVWGSRGEQVFVMNAAAAKKYGGLLSLLNDSMLSYARGGMLGRSGWEDKREAQIERVSGNLAQGLINSTISAWLLAGDFLQGIPPGVAAGVKNLAVGVPAMFAGKTAGKDILRGMLFAEGGFVNEGYLLGGFVKWLEKQWKGFWAGVERIGQGVAGVLDVIFGKPMRWVVEQGVAPLSDALEKAIMEVMKTIQKSQIMEWLRDLIGELPGFTWMAAQLVDYDVDKISTRGIVKTFKDMLSLENIWDWFAGLFSFHEGGILTKRGLRPFNLQGGGPFSMPLLRSDEVPFAGIGRVGEMLVPPGGAGTTVNINFTLQGIDRENARSAVRDYILPELNYYLTSKGASKL